MCVCVCVCVLVCLFMARSDFAGREGEPHRHSIQSNGVADDQLLLRHCRSFGLGERPRGSCVALVCAVCRGVRKGMMKALLGSIDALGRLQGGAL